MLKNGYNKGVIMKAIAIFNSFKRWYKAHYKQITWSQSKVKTVLLVHKQSLYLKCWKVGF